jgi:hypothetical protein
MRPDIPLVLVFGLLALSSACEMSPPSGMPMLYNSPVSQLPSSDYSLVPAGITSVTFRDCEQFATQIYDSAGSPSENTPYLAALLHALGLDDWLPPGSVDLISDYLSGGYVHQTLVDRESFSASLSQVGLRLNPLSGARPLTSLSATWTGLPTRQALTSTEIIPGLILALGRERNRRDKEGSDPLWGDANLDPLQVVLLVVLLTPPPEKHHAGSVRTLRSAWTDFENPLFVAFQSPTFSNLTRANKPQYEFVQYTPLGKLGPIYNLPPPPSPGLVPKLKNLVPADLILEAIGRNIGTPLGVSDAKDLMICGSILLYGVKAKFVNREPPPQQAIWHREVDRPDRPSQARFEVELDFDFKPEPGMLTHSVLVATQCANLPPQGPISGKTMVWENSPALSQHGHLLVQNSNGVETSTGSDGRTSAIFQTVDEVVPPQERTGHPPATASGVITVSARGVLPDHWRTAEVIIRATRDGDLPSSISSRLDVNYFGRPGYKIQQFIYHYGFDPVPLIVTGVLIDLRLCPVDDDWQVSAQWSWAYESVPLHPTSCIIGATLGQCAEFPHLVFSPATGASPSLTIAFSDRPAAITTDLPVTVPMTPTNDCTIYPGSLVFPPTMKP